LLAGALIPAQWVIHAQRLRSLFRTEVKDLFSHWDILIAPATPTPATPIGQDTLEIDGISIPLRPSFGVYTQPLSCIGLPVLVVPIPGALPIGVQLIAAPWAEAKLFRAAAALEAAGICAAPVAAPFRQ
jgi:Asp-tRNA(Asn)/Glu-tRNA(Gln) amidotransferase A subunit family amidase